MTNPRPDFAESAENIDFEILRKTLLATIEKFKVKDFLVKPANDFVDTLVGMVNDKSIPKPLASFLISGLTVNIEDKFANNYLSNPLHNGYQNILPHGICMNHGTADHATLTIPSMSFDKGSIVELGAIPGVHRLDKDMAAVLFLASSLIAKGCAFEKSADNYMRMNKAPELENSTVAPDSRAPIVNDSMPTG